MSIKGYLAKSATLAGVSVPQTVSWSYAFAGDRVQRSAGTPYNDCDAMINARGSCTCEIPGPLPAGLRPGVKGATTVTPLESGATNGLTWAAGTALDLGTMQVDGVESAVGDDGKMVTRVQLTSVGAPAFVTVT